MRTVAVLLLSTLAATALAGCAQPGDDKEADPLFGLCPQWAQGGGEQKSSIVLSSANRTVTRELGPAAAEYLDRPLDLYRVRVDRLELEGDLDLRATSANGTRLSIRDYRIEDAQMVPVVSLDPSAVGHEFDVFLSPVLHDGPLETAPASLVLSLDGSSAFLEISVTYHYKVCGA